MGRRKQKKLSFVQGNSLAEELEGSSDVEDVPGGLHIGGVVIRAPARSRTAEHPVRTPRVAAAAAPGGSSRAVHTRAQPHQLQQQELEQLFASEDSLDDELRDYLDNVKQHDEDSNEDLEQDRTAAAAAADQTSRRNTAGAAADSNSSEDWDELGSRPGLGFAGLSAAARFAAVSLDDALEGNLGRDMQQGNDSSGSDSSSSSSGGSSSSSGSDDSRSDEDAAEPVDLSSLDASTAVVVDAQGRPMAVWESLSLQQRFPVQTRTPATATEFGARRGGSSSSRSKQQQQGRRTPSRTSSGRASSGGILQDTSPPDMPAFGNEATAAAVKAAYAAALAAADLESVQRQQRRQQQKSLAKGAQRGQLLPGEKKRLRKEKIAAKRCARRGERGQGALALLAAVERFAVGGGGGDMEVLPPCGKHKQAFVRSVAALYGVHASAQGGSSSGRTCLVLSSTPGTAPPATAAAAAQLTELLAAELTREVTAAAIAAGTEQQHGAAAAAAAGVAGQQGGNGRQRERRALQRPRSRVAAGAAAVSAFQQPVAFVRGGTLDPNHSSTNEAGQQADGSTILPQPATAAAARDTANELSGLHDAEAADAAAAAVAAAAGQEDGVLQAGSAGEAAAGRSSARTVAAAAVVDVGEFLESLLLDVEEQTAPAASGGQLQQQQQQDEPAWMIDRDPCWPAGGAGLGFGRGKTQAAAAEGVPAAEAGCTVEVAAAAGDAAGDAAAPLYDRAPVRFGLGFSGGSGFVQQQQGGAQQHCIDRDIAGEAAAEDAAPAAAGPSSSRPGSQQLQALEDRFAALRAAPNPAAAKRQQRKERRQQQQQQQPRLEARLAAPNTALGPVVAAAGVSPLIVHAAVAAGNADESGDDGSGSLVITLGMTAQQVKRAKKQQLRNQRRESRQAAAADAPNPAAAAAAAAVGNVHGSFAGFEAHTLGIGSRLMAGWGWREGEGLGRARQGRPEPLLAVLRERQLGLGAE